MKKLLFGSLMAGLVLFSCAVEPVSDVDREKALDTAAYLNKFAYVLSVMETYRNVLALQEVYDEMSMNQIDTTRIPDVVAKSVNNKPMHVIITEMLEKINEMKLREREFKYFVRVNEDRRQAALQKMQWEMVNTIPVALRSAADAVGNAGSTGGPIGAAADMSPQGAAIKYGTVAGLKFIGEVIGGPLQSWGNYEMRLTELRAAYGEAKFKYDREKEAALHKTHKELITIFYDFAKQFGLKSNDLLNTEECKVLAEKLKGSDKIGIYDALNTTEMKRKYANFPPYWSYLAAFSVIAGDYQTAADAGENFTKLNRKLVKNDPLVARAAVAEVTGLLHMESTDDERIKRLIETIRDTNYGSMNAGWAYFCASVLYSRFGDKKGALEVLNASLSELRKKFKGELWEYRDLYSKGAQEVVGARNAVKREAVKDENGEVDIPAREISIPENADLVRANLLYKTICSDANGKVDYREMRRICETDVTTAQEKLYYAGSVNVNTLWRVAESDVDVITLSYEERCWNNWFVLQVPIQWFFLGEIGIKVELLSRDKVVSTLAEELRDRKVSLRPGGGSDIISLYFKCPGSKLKGVDGVRVSMDHKSWPVQLVFREKRGFERDFDQFLSEGSLNLGPTGIFFMGKLVREEKKDPRLIVEDGDLKVTFKIKGTNKGRFEVISPRRWLNSRHFDMGLKLFCQSTKAEILTLRAASKEGDGNWKFLDDKSVFSVWDVKFAEQEIPALSSVVLWATNLTSTVKVPYLLSSTNAVLEVIK